MKIQTPNPHRRRSAFTLLELIVAMLMVATLSVSLAESLRVALKATATARTSVEPSRTADLAMEFLRSDLQNAVQPGGQLAGNFEGTQTQDDLGQEADDLLFYSTADSVQHLDANGEIKQIELAIETTPTGDHVLVRRVIRNLLAQIEPNPDEEVLCRGVWSFTLQYFDGSAWHPTWDSTAEDNTVPAAVQITLEFQRPGAGNEKRTLSFTRTFQLPCSTAATDTAVNTGETMP